jgi:hypothetical protein
VFVYNYPDSKKEGEERLNEEINGFESKYELWLDEMATTSSKKDCEGKRKRKKKTLGKDFEENDSCDDESEVEIPGMHAMLYIVKNM